MSQVTAHGAPATFARTMQELYGEAGEAWLARLPDLLEACAAQWSLVVLPPFPNLTYNYVAPAVRADGREVVLKVGFPSRELATEMEALEIYDGCGIVQTVALDRSKCAFLLERLVPGAPLSEVGDDEAATSIAARVMKMMWRPVPPGRAFPSVRGWAAGLQKLRARYGGTSGPLPDRLVAEAEGLASELLGSMGEQVLLHGDLHHDNILSAEREPWLALDPKGVIGEREYEIGALLRNPMPQLLEAPDTGRILARRIDQLAEELELDRERIRGWGLAQAVLSAWWSIEDHGYGWERAIRCAELLEGSA